MRSSSLRPQLIADGLVLDSDGYRGRQDILVVDGVIAAVGPHGMDAPPEAEIVDASRFLVHPGLVNAHTHGHGNLARSSGDRWNLEMLIAAAAPMYILKSAEEKQLSATIGAAEMVMKGCSAAYDLFIEMPGPTEDGIDAVAEAYETVGHRAVIAPLLTDRGMYEAVPGLREMVPQDIGDDDEILPWQTAQARMRNILKNWRFDRDKIRPGVAPTIPMYCSDEFMIAVRDLANDFSVCMSSHIAESKVEAISGQKLYGRSIAAHLDRLGLLSEKFTAAHAVWLDPDDMKLLADRGASMAHSPASNMRLGNGIADVLGTLRAGVNIAIGTDGATCSDNLNMYSALQLAAIASRTVGPDPDEWLSADQVFKAATAGGAKALGFERIGRIAVGYHADLVFLDLDAPTLMPIHQPLNQVVFGEDGTSVHSVMVAGQFVVRDKVLLTLDLPALARKAASLRAELDDRQLHALPKFDRLSRVLADFCPAISKTKWPINRWCGCGSQSAVFQAAEVAR